MNGDTGMNRFPDWRFLRRGVALMALLAAFTLPAVPAAGEEEETPRPVRMVLLAYGDDNVVRSGPGPHYAIVTVLARGASFEVIAKSGEWINIRLSETETGWIHESLCHQYDDISDLEFRPNPRLYSRVGSFVLTGYVGGYSFDEKSNSVTAGGKLGYYLFDFLEFEGGVGWTHVNRPAEIVESLFRLTLEAEEFHMLFYEMNMNLKILPGRRLVPFVSGGLGSSIFRGRTEPSVNLGAGTMFFVSKKLALRWDIRNYRFEAGAGNARRGNNNFVFSIGTSLFY